MVSFTDDETATWRGGPACVLEVSGRAEGTLGLPTPAQAPVQGSPYCPLSLQISFPWTTNEHMHLHLRPEAMEEPGGDMETPFQNRLHHIWCLIGAEKGREARESIKFPPHCPVMAFCPYTPQKWAPYRGWSLRLC